MSEDAFKALADAWAATDPGTLDYADVLRDIRTQKRQMFQQLCRPSRVAMGPLQVKALRRYGGAYFAEPCQLTAVEGLLVTVLPMDGVIVS